MVRAMKTSQVGGMRRVAMLLMLVVLVFGVFDGAGVAVGASKPKTHEYDERVYGQDIRWGPFLLGSHKTMISPVYSGAKRSKTEKIVNIKIRYANAVSIQPGVTTKGCTTYWKYLNSSHTRAKVVTRATWSGGFTVGGNHFRVNKVYYTYVLFKPGGSAWYEKGLGTGPEN